MTQAFLIVVRILLTGLIAYWGYRLWIGTRSWATRAIAMLFSATLVWQIVGGTL